MDDVVFMFVLRGYAGPYGEPPMPWLFGLVQFFQWLYQLLPQVSWYSSYLFFLFGYCFTATIQLLREHLPYNKLLNLVLAGSLTIMCYNLYGNNFTWSYISMWGTGISMIWFLKSNARLTKGVFAVFTILCMYVRPEAGLLILLVQCSLLFIYRFQLRSTLPVWPFILLCLLPLAQKYYVDGKLTTLQSTMLDNCPQQQSIDMYRTNPALINWMGNGSYGFSDPKAVDSPEAKQIIIQCNTSLWEKIKLVTPNIMGNKKFFAIQLIVFSLILFAVNNLGLLQTKYLKYAAFVLALWAVLIVFTKVVDRLFYPLMFCITLTIIYQEKPSAKYELNGLWLIVLSLFLSSYFMYKRHILVKPPLRPLPSVPANELIATLTSFDIFYFRKVGVEQVFPPVKFYCLQGWTSWGVYKELKDQNVSFPHWLDIKSNRAKIFSDRGQVQQINQYLRISHGIEIDLLDSTLHRGEEYPFVLKKSPVYFYSYRIKTLPQP